MKNKRKAALLLALFVLILPLSACEMEKVKEHLPARREVRDTDEPESPSESEHQDEPESPSETQSPSESERQDEPESPGKPQSLGEPESQDEPEHDGSLIPLAASDKEIEKIYTAEFPTRVTQWMGTDTIQFMMPSEWEFLGEEGIRRETSEGDFDGMVYRFGDGEQNRMVLEIIAYDLSGSKFALSFDAKKKELGLQEAEDSYLRFAKEEFAMVRELDDVSELVAGIMAFRGLRYQGTRAEDGRYVEAFVLYLRDYLYDIRLIAEPEEYLAGRQVFNKVLSSFDRRRKADYGDEDYGIYWLNMNSEDPFAYDTLSVETMLEGVIIETVEAYQSPAAGTGQKVRFQNQNKVPVTFMYFAVFYEGAEEVSWDEGEMRFITLAPGESYSAAIHTSEAAERCEIEIPSIHIYQAVSDALFPPLEFSTEQEGQKLTAKAVNESEIPVTLVSLDVFYYEKGELVFCESVPALDDYGEGTLSHQENMSAVSEAPVDFDEVDVTYRATWSSPIF